MVATSVLATDTQNLPEYDPELTFLQLSASGAEEHWASWLNRNKVPLDQTGQLSSPTFMEIRDAFEGKRLIMLGEAGHAISEIQVFKSNLVQQLSKNVGFEVVAFESSMMDAYLANAQLEESLPEDILRRRFRKHYQSEEIVELITYTAGEHQSSGTLFLAGIDIAFEKGGQDFYRDYLAVVNEAYAQEAYDLWWQLSTDNPQLLDPLNFYRENAYTLSEELSTLTSFIDLHADELDEAYPDAPHLRLFARRTADAMSQFLEALVVDNLSWDDVFQARDQIMAENVIFLLEKAYPDKKLIVWAHNDHVRMDSPLGSYKSMGEYLSDELGDDVHVTGSMVLGGIASDYRGGEIVIPQYPSSAYLECIFQGNLSPAGFLKFDHVQPIIETAWLFVPAKIFGVEGRSEVVLSESFDSVFYFESVSAPKFLW